MDVFGPSLPPVKLVGDKLITRPHHAAHIRALGRLSAVCNLCFMLVIVLIYLIRASTHFARAQFYTVATWIVSRSFLKKLFYARFDNLKTSRVASTLTTRSVPAPLARVKTLPLAIVIWPPESTVTWSANTEAATVTVCPLRIVTAFALLSGDNVAAIHAVVPSCELSHVDEVPQLPDVADL